MTDMAPADSTDTAALTRPGWPLVAVTAAVTVGAAAATAHGLYEVALSAGVSAPVAAIYPLVTDGLALVAYASTRRLPRARYPWVVVCVAAGLSGLAQAAELAIGGSAPAWLRFGVGAWPAVAAVSAAHLLYLVSRRPPVSAATVSAPVSATAPVQPSAPAPRPVTPPVRKAAARKPPTRTDRPDVAGTVTALQTEGRSKTAAVKQAATDHGLSVRQVWRALDQTEPDEPTDRVGPATVTELRSARP